MEYRTNYFNQVRKIPESRICCRFERYIPRFVVDS
jgi:hypothetical protein